MNSERKIKRSIGIGSDVLIEAAIPNEGGGFAMDSYSLFNIQAADESGEIAEFFLAVASQTNIDLRIMDFSIQRERNARAAMKKVINNQSYRSRANIQ